MEKRHACEREFFEVLLQEEQYSVKAEQLRMMSKENQEDRLFELKVFRTIHIFFKKTVVCLLWLHRQQSNRRSIMQPFLR